MNYEEIVSTLNSLVNVQLLQKRLSAVMNTNIPIEHVAQ